MSKKSRKRNKKILAMLALAGGAAMMGRGKGAASTVGQPVGVNRMSTNTPPIGGTDHITKSAPADAAVVAPKKVVLGNSRLQRNGMGPNETAIANKLTAGNRVPPSMRGGALHAEGYQRRVPGGGRRTATWTGGHSLYKKGGRVTGIAKRGFGRALMKGKK